MRHGGGLDALIAHLRTDLHSEDPLAGKRLNMWQEKETPFLDNYEKVRLSKGYGISLFNGLNLPSLEQIIISTWVN